MALGISDVVSSIELRLVRPTDLVAIQRLCLECFPVRYPDIWYNELVSTSRYVTLLACLRHFNTQCFKEGSEEAESVVGFIVAEYRPISSCKMADRTIIHPRLADESVVMYILSLAVTSQYRKCGIGSLLLSVIVDHAKRQRDFANSCSNDSTLKHRLPIESQDCNTLLPLHLSSHQEEFVRWLWQHHRTHVPCRAVYLHTECTNRIALRFYRHRGFSLHHLVPRCYFINGRFADGFCCVLHCNGGYPRRSLAQECLCWLRQRVCGTRSTTMALIGQVLSRLRAAISALIVCPSPSSSRGPLSVKGILNWHHHSPPPDSSITPLLVYSK